MTQFYYLFIYIGWLGHYLQTNYADIGTIKRTEITVGCYKRSQFFKIISRDVISLRM